jgi:hypothetical protein
MDVDPRAPHRATAPGSARAGDVVLTTPISDRIHASIPEGIVRCPSSAPSNLDSSGLTCTFAGVCHNCRVFPRDPSKPRRMPSERWSSCAVRRTGALSRPCAPRSSIERSRAGTDRRVGPRRRRFAAASYRPLAYGSSIHAMYWSIFFAHLSPLCRQRSRGCNRLDRLTNYPAAWAATTRLQNSTSCPYAMSAFKYTSAVTSSASGINFNSQPSALTVANYFRPLPPLPARARLSPPR